MRIPKCLLNTQVSISRERSQSPTTTVLVLIAQTVAPKPRFPGLAKKPRRDADLKPKALEKQTFRP
jgi:hypothetical protein